jgi:hypothetical protein
MNVRQLIQARLFYPPIGTRSRRIHLSNAIAVNGRLIK